MRTTCRLLVMEPGQHVSGYGLPPSSSSACPAREPLDCMGLEARLSIGEIHGSPRERLSLRGTDEVRQDAIRGGCVQKRSLPRRTSSVEPGQQCAKSTAFAKRWRRACRLLLPRLVAAPPTQRSSSSRRTCSDQSPAPTSSPAGGTGFSPPRDGPKGAIIHAVM